MWTCDSWKHSCRCDYSSAGRHKPLQNAMRRTVAMHQLRLPCAQACQCKLQQVKCKTPKGYAPQQNPGTKAGEEPTAGKARCLNRVNLISKISHMQAFCSYIPKQYIAWTQPWQCDSQPGKVNKHLQHTQGARFQRTKIASLLMRSTRTILRKVCAGNSQIAILHDPTKRLHRHRATKLRFYY